MIWFAGQLVDDHEASPNAVAARCVELLLAGRKSEAAQVAQADAARARDAAKRYFDQLRRIG